MKLSIEEIVEATDGRLLAAGRTAAVRGVSINSKTVQRGDCFIAIRGERHDGHKFVAEAVQKGAAAVVLSKNVTGLPSSATVIRVKDTTLALGELARHYRKKFKIPLIAVTGSAGKTTTKNLLAVVLAKRYRVLKNEGTQNNHIGVPLTLFKLKEVHQVAVVEVGTNRPGDIRWLTHVASPDIAIFTNIGESHLERLKTPANVFKEKFELAKGLAAKATIIFNGDDAFLKKLPRLRRDLRYVSFGRETDADYSADQLKMEKDSLSFRINGRYRMKLKTRTPANSTNALAAAACGRVMGVSFAAIARALADFRFSTGRQSVNRVGGCWLIDDSYNANPVSARSALETLAGFNGTGRKIFICGDMLELGSQAKPLHESVGAFAASRHVNMIFAFGRRAQWIGRAARKADHRIAVRHTTSREELHRWLEDICRREDVILVKGSRGMKMDETVAFLTRHLKKPKTA